jgi:hypothetical protein
MKAASNGGLCYGVTTAMRSNEIISYIEMCTREGLSLQRGMNFNATETHSIVLSSLLIDLAHHMTICLKKTAPF